MRRSPIIAMILVVLLLAAGCAGAKPAPATPAPAPTVAQPVALPAATQPAPTVAPTATLEPSPVPPTATPVPSATPAPTETPLPTATATPQPSPTPTEPPAPAVTVKSATLNVRGGPNTSYDIVAPAKEGDSLPVAGQIGVCAWLKVEAAGGVTGWVIGDAEYVTLNVPCADVPEAKAPPAPTPRPPTATRPAPPTPTAAPAATTAPSSGSSDLPANQGCYLFTNYVGDELNITFTAKDRPWNITFKLPAMGEKLVCFDPGRYSYTMDHPKWTGGGQLEVFAGQHFRFPIAARP